MRPGNAANDDARLRKHFEDDPANPKHFQTVRGRGYRFVKEPEGESA